MVLYVVASIREQKKLSTIMRDLQGARKGKGVAFDQPKDSSPEFDLGQHYTLPSLGMPSEMEEKSKESFGILSEELCHFLARVGVLVSSHCSPFPPDVVLT